MQFEWKGMVKRQRTFIKRSVVKVRKSCLDRYWLEQDGSQEPKEPQTRFEMSRSTTVQSELNTPFFNVSRHFTPQIVAIMNSTTEDDPFLQVQAYV
jgi:hypothetical protein